jgi:4-amino-4-deoxy-L-arabinose transferase-like glycosyltransferase
MPTPQPPAHTAGLSNATTAGDGPLRRWALPLLLALALLHGLQYAALMPPWGLIDEAQHVDYILRLAEGEAPPVAGVTPLSPSIVESLFAVRHWAVFHWSTPTSAAVEELGPGGYSYEAYHPPLFYQAMGPVYRAAPGAILDRLFVLRGAVVLLSLAAVYLLYRLGVEVSGSILFGALAALIFVLLPERTAYVSRVNNDVLAELLGAAIVLGGTRAILHGMSRRLALGLGVLLAGGIWTKLSLVFWLPPLALAAILLWRRPDGRRWLLPLGVGGLAAGGLLLRNRQMYGDLTGFSAFHALYPFPKPPLSLGTVGTALGDLLRHFWFIWWKGSQVGDSPLVALIYWVLGLLVMGSVFLLLRGAWRWAKGRPQWRGQWRAQRRTDPRPLVFVFLGAGAVVYAGMAVYTYLQGIVPLIQGRFLAPAVAAYLVLFALGWWQWRHGAAVLLLTGGFLLAVDLLVLWGNLLPYHYYWSSVNAALGGLSPQGSEALALFWSNLAADKPPAVVPLLPWLTAAYLLVAGATFVVCGRAVFHSQSAAAPTVAAQPSEV